MREPQPGDVILVHREAIGNRRAFRVRVDRAQLAPAGAWGKYEVWGIEVTRMHVPRVYFASKQDTSRSRFSAVHAFLGEDGWEFEKGGQ